MLLTTSGGGSSPAWLHCCTAQLLGLSSKVLQQTRQSGLKIGLGWAVADDNVSLDDGKFPWLKTSTGMKMDLERDFLPSTPVKET